MEQKTKIKAEDGKQELVITREFDLPLELLFKAYVEPEIVEQWMGTKVLKLESKKHGSWQFETTDAKGNVVFQAIADPTRRAILLLVASQSLTAGAIAANFDTARPTVSKHLQILTECELLEQEQNGREIYYHINAKK